MNLWRKPVWQEYDGGVVAAHSNANLPDHPGRKVIRCPMETATRRLEERVSLTIRVDLYSLDIRKPAQEGITENVSTHGVRVVSGKPLKLNERLNLRSLPGDLRARARVVYCEPWEQIRSPSDCNSLLRREIGNNFATEPI